MKNFSKFALTLLITAVFSTQTFAKDIEGPTKDGEFIAVYLKTSKSGKKMISFVYCESHACNSPHLLGPQDWTSVESLQTEAALIKGGVILKALLDGVILTGGVMLMATGVGEVSLAGLAMIGAGGQVSYQVATRVKKLQVEVKKADLLSNRMLNDQPVYVGNVLEAVKMLNEVLYDVQEN